ncbi:MAG TPA: hypothetical protein PKH43_12600, partial [Saprospiraceae bacterium]|nr:hypothetical protein [Saprospiraceae bacterium]
MTLSTLGGSLGDCEGDVVHFVAGGIECGTGVYCAYADLFTIVVNAYAGEVIRVNCISSLYESYDENEVCADISCLGGNNLTTISSPLAPTTAPNNGIQIQLGSPTTNPDGSCDVQVLASNSNTASVTANYMEFMVKVAMAQLMEPLAITSNYDRPVLEDGMDRYIHFIVPENQTIAGNGGTVLLGTIRVNPPTLTNQDWSATLSLVDETKSRLETSACTRLPLSSTSRVCEHIGTPLCGGSIDASLVISGPDGMSDCNALIVKVGLQSNNPPATLNLFRISFTIVFDASSGVEIDYVDFGDWFPACPNTANLCGLPTGECYEILGGNTLHFCASVTNSSNPISFSLNPAEFMEIHFNAPAGGCINNAKLTFFDIVPVNADLCIPGYLDPQKFPVCMPQATGLIATETGDPVESVIVAMNDDCGPDVTCDFSMTTSDPGEYGLCPDCSQDCLQYTIKPTRNDNPMNGVSTFDLVLMSKHILGITPLNSPYKIIAADVNKSNSVTAFDIVELRKLILGIYTELPNNSSWRFIDQTFTFANPANPFASAPFQEETSVDFSAGPSVGADFVGIKIGDINNSVLANRPGRRPELGIDCTLPAARAGE